MNIPLEISLGLSVLALMFSSAWLGFYFGKKDSKLDMRKNVFVLQSCYYKLNEFIIEFIIDSDFFDNSFEESAKIHDTMEVLHAEIKSLEEYLD